MRGRIVIIGGGHNGLTAAGLLAKAGRDVLVLEGRAELGGLAAPRTPRAGWTIPGILHDTAMVRPHVVAALDLEKHGLKRRSEATPIYAPSGDGTAVTIRGDTVTGDLAEGEQARWEAFRAFIDTVRPVVERLMDAPPLSADGGMWALLKTGWAVRRLGGDTMMELIRVAPMCVADWMRDSFQTERLGSAVALRGMMGAFTGPWSAHTAALLLIRETLAPQTGGAIVGGGAALVATLAKAAESHGAVLRTGAQVFKINTDSEGVTGVTLADGETIGCERVISTLDPKKTFGELVGPVGLPLRLSDDVRNYRMRANTAVVSVLMNGPLETKDGEVIESMRTGDRLDDIERAFDAAKYRIIADRPALDVHVPSVMDPSLCPDGSAIVQILAHGVPADYAGGWEGDEGRDIVGDRVIREMVRLCPSMSDRIVDAEVLTPLDIARTYGVTNGHLLHGEHAPDQLIFMRPTGQTGQYHTPIPGLWLGGGSSHPGGGLTCGPGSLAAGAILAVKKGR